MKQIIVFSVFISLSLLCSAHANESVICIESGNINILVAEGINKREAICRANFLLASTYMESIEEVSKYPSLKAAYSSAMATHKVDEAHCESVKTPANWDTAREVGLKLIFEDNDRRTNGEWSKKGLTPKTQVWANTPTELVTHFFPATPMVNKDIVELLKIHCK